MVSYRFEGLLTFKNRSLIHSLIQSVRQFEFLMTTKLYVHVADRFPYRPNSSTWMMTYISLSFIFFSLLQRSISFQSTWFQKNTFISWIHSSISSILLIIGVVRAPEMFDDPLSHNNHFNSALVAFSLGYFLFDFVDFLFHTKSWFSAILLHHLIAIVFLAEVLFNSRNVGYALYGLSLEMNSIFLHARRLCQWFYPTRTKLKRFIYIGNIVTFVVFRFIIVSFGLRALITESDRLNPLIHRLVSVFSLTITVMNFVLFYRILQKKKDE